MRGQRLERTGAALAIGLVFVAACAADTADDDDMVDVPGVGVTRMDVPRPTTGGLAGCALAFEPDLSLDERVRGLRDIGLFADASSTDAELAAEVEAAIAETWGEVPEDDPTVELLIAEQDRSRVWWRDLEADVAEGSDVYAVTLGEWAAISGDSFVPTSIVETWESPTGPITVSFELEGAAHVLEPEYLEDWIDIRILGDINELTSVEGRDFALVKAFDQTAYVISLTTSEQRALEGRGWCFE
jgi:hypothetical protein